MSKKKINAPFYTEVRLGISSLFNDTRLPNGWLYSNGKNRTRIKPDDLPNNYIPLMVYKVDGYLRIDGIKDIVYKPNYHIKHMHKDDFLYISYETSNYMVWTDDEQKKWCLKDPKALYDFITAETHESAKV